MPVQMSPPPLRTTDESLSLARPRSKGTLQCTREVTQCVRLPCSGSVMIIPIDQQQQGYIHIGEREREMHYTLHKPEMVGK